MMMKVIIMVITTIIILYIYNNNDQRHSSEKKKPKKNDHYLILIDKVLVSRKSKNLGKCLNLEWDFLFGSIFLPIRLIEMIPCTIETTRR